MRRRDFLAFTMAAGAGAALSGCVSRAPAFDGRRKKLLVLGGTNYLGPAIVEHAVAGGHDVTLFNRGITRPELFPSLEKLRGDRRESGGDLTMLAGRRRWDAVIDVWPAQSALVERTAELLAERTDYYFFCSSIAVYRDLAMVGLSETSPVHENDPGWYGGEKALAEQAVARLFAGRFGVSRCHAIFGPRDDGVAFHYWLRRLARQDEVLAPGTGRDPVQFVDVRDVAAWVVDCVERHRVGIHNLCGPRPPLSFRAFLEGTRAAIGSQARLVWVDADFLRDEMKLQSFTNLPLWAPLDEDAGFYQIDGRKALDAGIKYRPLADTAADAWHWYRAHFFRDTTFPVGGFGLTREREAEVLSAWQERG